MLQEAGPPGRPVVRVEKQLRVVDGEHFVRHRVAHRVRAALVDDAKLRWTVPRIERGGFLGFGGKLVEVPEGKFTKSGDNVRLGMTAEEVSKLPEVKNQS